jgi:adenylate cyclase
MFRISLRSSEPLAIICTMIADEQLKELVAWIADAGLSGQSELMLVTGFCERAAAAGLPLARAHLLIDTLDPVHEGRVFRWGFDANLPAEQDYGRTSSVAGPATSGSSLAPAAQHIDAWRSSPFYRMRETGASLLRRRLPATDETEFKVLVELRAAGGQHRRHGLRLLLLGDPECGRI